MTFASCVRSAFRAGKSARLCAAKVLKRSAAVARCGDVGAIRQEQPLELV